MMQHQKVLLSIGSHSHDFFQVQVVQPSPRAALTGSQRIQAMMEQVKVTAALSPADMSQIIQRVQAASPAKVPQSPVRSRDSSGRGRRRSPKNDAKQVDDAVPSPGQAERFEWEVDTKDIICVRLLGSGSFGEVWRGIWLGTPVAVKKVCHVAFWLPPMPGRTCLTLLSGAHRVSPRTADTTRFQARGRHSQQGMGAIRCATSDLGTTFPFPL